MRTIPKYLFLVLAVFCWLSTTCMAKDAITWGIDWSPPSNVAEISQSGGITGEVLGVLVNELSQYDHQFREMNLLRIMKSLEDQQNFCCNYLFKTPEREKIGYFSLPLRINLPLRAIMRKEAFKDLGQPEKISFLSLLEDTQLRSVFEQGRSYSVLDPIIDRFSGDSTITVEVITNDRQFKMLAANRIDFLIDYSYALANSADAMEQYNDGRIVFVGIEEIFEYAFSYVVCPKNDWGMKVIKDVNRVLREEVAKESYLKILKRPFKLKEEQQEISKIYNSQLFKEYE